MLECFGPGFQEPGYLVTKKRLYDYQSYHIELAVTNVYIVKVSCNTTRFATANLNYPIPEKPKIKWTVLLNDMLRLHFSGIVIAAKYNLLNK